MGKRNKSRMVNKKPESMAELLKNSGLDFNDPTTREAFNFIRTNPEILNESGSRKMVYHNNSFRWADELEEEVKQSMRNLKVEKDSGASGSKEVKKLSEEEIGAYCDLKNPDAQKVLKFAKENSLVPEIRDNELVFRKEKQQGESKMAMEFVKDNKKEKEELKVEEPKPKKQMDFFTQFACSMLGVKVPTSSGEKIPENPLFGKITELRDEKHKAEKQKPSNKAEKQKPSRALEFKKDSRGLGNDQVKKEKQREENKWALKFAKDNNLAGYESPNSSESPDDVEDMEESCDDSDYLELINQGREDHPLVKYTRLVKTKKDELEYKYNPDVERNKGKNMVPQWEAAKKTVEGAIYDLGEIIKEKKSKGENNSGILKLEVVERDLQLLNMKFQQHIDNSEKYKDVDLDKLSNSDMRNIVQKYTNNINQMGMTKDELDMYNTPEMQKQNELDIQAIYSLMEKSKKARQKYTEFFFCKKKCSVCKKSEDRNSTQRPCLFEDYEFCFEGVLVKYAFLTCVRSRDPKLREKSMETFRNLTNIDDTVDGSDIKKMIEMRPNEFMKFLLDEVENMNIVTIFSHLVFSAVKAVMKLTCANEYEIMARETIRFLIETDLDEVDEIIHNTLFEQDGFFGFINWFSKFLLLSLSSENLLEIPAQMFIFNLEVGSVLTKISKYGTDTFPWYEAMIFNFTKIFKLIWTTPNSDEWKINPQDFISPVAAKRQKDKLILTQSVVPRFNKESCGQCRRRITKSPKLYPVAFHGALPEEYWPREIARMERPEVEWSEEVSMEHMEKCRRSVLIICGAKCLLQAMSQMNPNLHEICKTVPKILKLKTCDFKTFVELGLPDDEDKFEDFIHRTESEKIETFEVAARRLLVDCTDQIKYFNLKYIIEFLYPRGIPLTLINGVVELDHAQAKKNKERRKMEEKEEEERKKEEERERERENSTEVSLKDRKGHRTVGLDPDGGFTLYIDGVPQKEKPISVAASFRGPGDPLTVFQSSGKAMKLPVSMTDYSENLLLPSKKTKKSCEPPPYSQLWGGWAKFHPLNDIKKYNEYYDDYGYSKSCIDFQLKIETCDQLDLKLMSCTEREKLSTTLRDFRLKTLQMFPFYPTDLVVNYLRDNCYKVVLSGPEGHDNVAINKMFTSVPCVLGLWESSKPGIFIFKNSKTCFGFIPYDWTSDEFYQKFYRIMFFTNKKAKIFPVVSRLRKLFVERELDPDKEQEFFWKTSEYPVSTNNFMYSLFAKAVMSITEERSLFEETIKESEHKVTKFAAIHQNRHNDATQTLLMTSSDNGITRYSPKHLIGCPHELAWSGRVHFTELKDGVVHPRYHCSSMAYACRVLTEDLIKDNIGISADFLKVLQMDTIEIMLMKFGRPVDQDTEIKPIMIFEMGTINEHLVKSIQDRYSMAVTFLPGKIKSWDGKRECPNQYLDMEFKYIIRYHFKDGKIYGRIMNQYSIDKYLNCIHYGQDIPNMIDILSRHLENNRKQIRTSGMPKYGQILWAGEMQTLIATTTSDQQVLGVGVSEQLLNLSRKDLIKAQECIDEEDLGACRNSTFQASNGHFVNSCYTAVTAFDATPDMETFFKKARDSAISFLAINVEKNIVENLIGSFKKCYSVHLHIQDGFWMVKELRDRKTIMLAFFLEKDEHISEIMKLTPSEAAKRIVILRHDVRENITAGYVPKEKGKLEQIWKAASKGTCFSTHEKLLKKLKRHEPPTVNIKTTITADPETNTMESVSVISCEKSKKSKKKDKNGSGDEKDGNTKTSDINENFKKMFQKENEKEKSKNKICWNCHISGEGIKLSKCSVCKKARYCSRECQVEDWERHKDQCQKILEKKKNKEKQESD